MQQPIESPISVFETAQSYDSYIEMLNDLVAQNKTTGPNQSEAYINYTRQNLQRKSRINRTLRLTEDQIDFFSTLPGKFKWLVITEGWCGDASAILPILNQLAKLNKQIELRITLRDEHPTLMDQFLTNGSRSIPVLIVMDTQGQVIGSWGPRPKEAQDILIQMKQDPLVIQADINIALQKWYAKDKGRTTIEEVQQLLKAPVLS
ncbi:MAG: thioredoxin family protein [Saprospiraceae bacterium]|nr:thioredoxin family protein [Saprospiraceae bacterium]